MLIQFKASKIWKAVDCMTGKPVDHVEIKVNQEGAWIRNKGGGFYVAVNLPPGEYNAIALHKEYEKRTFTFTAADGADVETLLLTPERGRRGVAGVTLAGQIKGRFKGKETPFYYGAFRKGLDRRVMERAQAGEKLIKMEYGVREPMDYRIGAAENGKEILSIAAYSFLDKGYHLSAPLKEGIAAGSRITALQEGIIQRDGQFCVLLGNQYTTGERRIGLVFFINGKRYQAEADLDRLTVSMA